MDKMKLLLGGPGTGKTYTLINMIQEAKPDNFALLSFTKQAANEAKQRLKSIYKNKELDYVRTIHSLAFKCLNLKQGCIFDHDHLKAFGNEYGFDFSNRFRVEEDGTQEGLTEDDIIYRRMLMNEYNKSNELIEEDFNVDSILHMFKLYKKYKKFNDLFDFNDLLLRCLDVELPKFDLLCIDETQDLSPLQFEVINKLIKNSKEVIFAGDDDQMIYEWAGVKREHFLELSKKCQLIILTNNYRLTPDIMNMSRRIIARCSEGIDKDAISIIGSKIYKEIIRISDIAEIEFKKDLSYLILVRNNYLLNNVRFLLNELNLPWSYLQYKSDKVNIHLSTIHGAKGAEADVVILLSDCSAATYEGITRDSEHRVWYVGITRAKKQLIIVDPQGPYSYDI
jgi:superfamily I DNA/RNA helicase